MKTYIALVRKDEDSDYGVDFPDFPGCITAGSTLGEARELAVETLTSHIEEMRGAGHEIPRPSTFHTIMANPHNRGVDAILITV